MALSDIIGTLETALADTKAQLKEVNAKIADAEHRRLKVLHQPPHTEDIAAAFKRGLSTAEQSFVSRMALHLSPSHLREETAAAKVANSNPQVLMVGAKHPAALPGHGSLLPYGGLGDEQLSIDVAAVTYFLRDRIAAELPALIAKICPDAENGIRQVDRLRQLSKIDQEIGELKKEQDRLQGEIYAARKVVAPNG